MTHIKILLSLLNAIEKNKYQFYALWCEQIGRGPIPRGNDANRRGYI